MSVDTLKELLEAYDIGERPFNQDSTAYDLQKELEPVIEQLVEERAQGFYQTALLDFKKEGIKFIDQFIEEQSDE